MAQPDRQALIVGNAAYRHQGRLRNPVNDAHGVQLALDPLNFGTTYETNQNINDLRVATTAFIRDVEEGDIVIFYFSGHGLQFNNINYLVACDAPLMTRNNFQNYCLDAQNFLESLAQKSPSLILFILDCCRDNPFVEYRDFGNGCGFRHGLAMMQMPRTTTRAVNRRQPTRKIISYACQPGCVAMDDGGPGRGLYAYHLLAQITRRAPISTWLQGVQSAVQRASGNQQIPHIADSDSIRNDNLSDTDSGPED